MVDRVLKISFIYIDINIDSYIYIDIDICLQNSTCFQGKVDTFFKQQMDKCLFLIGKQLIRIFKKEEEKKGEKMQMHEVVIRHDVWNE